MRRMDCLKQQRKGRSLIKFFFVLVVCLCAGVYLHSFSSSRVISTLVVKTRKHPASDEAKEELSSVDDEYLFLLGFNTSSPRLYPRHRWTNVSLPVIVTMLLPAQVDSVLQLIHSARHVRVEGQPLAVIVYNLGASESEMEVLAEVCNISGSSWALGDFFTSEVVSSEPADNYTAWCQLRDFQFDQFPFHLSIAHVRAVIPVIIQEVLNQAGAVLWIDTGYRFVQSESDLTSLITRAKRVGVAAWSTNFKSEEDSNSALPITAVTHPRMFRFFRVDVESLYFHRMVADHALLLYNTETVHNYLMRRWLACALLWDCVAPAGAHPNGCHFDRRPHFRYAGCHRYATSALNLALGTMFAAGAPYMVMDQRPFTAVLSPSKSLSSGQTTPSDQVQPQYTDIFSQKYKQTYNRQTKLQSDSNVIY